MVSGEALQGLAPRAVLRLVETALNEAGVPDADFDARQLWNAVSPHDPRLCSEPLDAAQAVRLADLTARRAAREPLQYLLGEWDFLDFTLKVGPGVLCPRADTEIVCETALDCLQEVRQPVVWDLCAGTGCLGLGVKRFRLDAAVTCVEYSGEALPYLRSNAAHALPKQPDAVTVLQGDVLQGPLALQAPAEGLDLIVSNPPYLTAEEMAQLMPETAHEPALALDGGDDGLVFYRCLLQQWGAALRPGGWLVLEIGCDQAAAVTALAAQYGWQQVCCRKDYGGNDRVVVARKKL